MSGITGQYRQRPYPVENFPPEHEGKYFFMIYFLKFFVKIIDSFTKIVIWRKIICIVMTQT